MTNHNLLEGKSVLITAAAGTGTVRDLALVPGSGGPTVPILTISGRLTDVGAVVSVRP